jgi:hypothetical protein
MAWFAWFAITGIIGVITKGMPFPVIGGDIVVATVPVTVQNVLSRTGSTDNSKQNSSPSWVRDTSFLMSVVPRSARFFSSIKRAAFSGEKSSSSVFPIMSSPPIPGNGLQTLV